MSEPTKLPVKKVSNQPTPGEWRAGFIGLGAGVVLSVLTLFLYPSRPPVVNVTAPEAGMIIEKADGQVLVQGRPLPPLAPAVSSKPSREWNQIGRPSVATQPPVVPEVTVNVQTPKPPETPEPQAKPRPVFTPTPVYQRRQRETDEMESSLFGG